MLQAILLLAPVANPVPDSTWTSPLAEPLYFQEDAAVEEVVEVEGTSPWSGSVTINASQTYGNSDIATAGINIDATRETMKANGEDLNDRTTLNSSVNYTENTTGSGLGKTTLLQRRRSADAQYDKFLDPTSYLLAQAGIADDTGAALDGRWTVGLGYGYQISDTDTWGISAEAGVSFVDEDLSTVPGNEDYTSIRVAYNVDWTGSEKWSWSHSGEIFPSTEDFGDANQDIYGKFDTKVNVNLTESMFAQLQSIVDYDNTPAGVGAAEFDRVDHLLLLSVGWTF
ncbi:MAG: hypothetical protein ACI841_005371 [Planctomycetota bacterium]|jgi:hypothetical protein